MGITTLCVQHTPHIDNRALSMHATDTRHHPLIAQTMKRYKMPAIRLALIPGLVEAFYDGGIATAPGLFGMPVLLGFSMGFILKAVGPGLVVPAMFKLQKLGYGRDQGGSSGAGCRGRVLRNHQSH